MRRAHARHHVLALRVDQIFAVKNSFAACWVARECNSGRAGVAHVSEHHCLDIDRRSPIVRESVLSPVNNRAIIHPRAKNRADRAPKLFLRVLWKRFAGPCFD